ncbi:hypothetical protein ACN28E_47935 [Archangium lansingense]|uniref:hypothetical protein n=1 Tax=Archangium lansingense TaxID=2995310 RepID=UPI003B825167
MHKPGVFVVGPWLLALLLLGLTSPTLAASAPASAAELHELLQTFRRLKEPPEHDEEPHFERLGLEDPYTVIVRAALEHPEPGHVIAKLRERYALNAAAARALLLGQLVTIPPDDPWATLTPEQVRRALESYLTAAHEAPGSLVVLTAILTLPQSYLVPKQEFEARFLEALDAAPAPVETAVQLSRMGGDLHGWHVPLAALAVSRQPEVLPRALEALGLGEHGRTATLFYFAAFQALRAHQDGDFPAATAERLLRNLLKQQQPSLAVELARQLPATAREALLAGRWTVQDSHYISTVGGDRIEVEPPGDLRPGLAAALLLGGDTQAAADWFAHAAPVPSNLREQGKDCSPEVHHALLSFLLKPEPGADPFSLLVADARCGRVLEYPWNLMLAQVFQSRYQEEARDHLSLAVESERRKPDVMPLQAHLTFLDGARATFEAADKERLARLESALAALPKQTGDSMPAAEADPVAPRIRELLAAPSASAFTEHPLAEAPKTKPSPRWSPIKSGLQPPAGFHAVRAERSGKRVLLLALSQRLDPVGEVSGGGYWLLESQDGGRTWSSLVYTGLRQYRPYELAKKSSLPMLDGDTLRLEASMRELEEKSITFPPLKLTTKREKKNLFLQARLSELQKDSDTDGLPDLVEERFLTDPKAADTDADGLSDGEDPLPQVPAVDRSSEGPEVRLLAAFLAMLNEGEHVQKGLEVGLPDEDSPQDVLRLPKGTTPESRYDVTFLEMKRGGLRGVRLTSRTLVFTSEEIAKAEERFGRFFGLDVSLLLNAKGDQALITWNERWRGGRYLARIQNGQWVFESLSSWIT